VGGWDMAATRLGWWPQFFAYLKIAAYNFHSSTFLYHHGMQNGCDVFARRQRKSREIQRNSDDLNFVSLLPGELSLRTISIQHEAVTHGGWQERMFQNGSAPKLNRERSFIF
jgi:hypothetical protein